MNQSLRYKIFEKFKGICSKCGIKTRFYYSAYDGFNSDDTVAGSVDHIIPISNGGTNDPSNLRWMCRSCNCSIGNRGELYISRRMMNEQV